jgi:hypothetical protein
MAAFVAGQTVIASQPAVVVDAITVPGLYRFQLVVVDDANVASAPTTLLVRIKEQATPEA